MGLAASKTTSTAASTAGSTAGSTGGIDDLLAAAVSPGAGSAAVLLASHSGEIAVREARGVTRVWDTPGVPTTAPSGPVSERTRFDLASVTKPIVATALLTELENRGLDPSIPVADVLSEFRPRELRDITVAHLLSHTAGFPPAWEERSWDPGAERFRASARPVGPAGNAHVYSCVGFIWAGIFAAELGGKPLDKIVEEHVLRPLGMSGTGYLPALHERPFIAATEYQDGRGMVQGEVHDEAAFTIGGVSGNAGLFGTAPDLLRFAEAVRTGDGISEQVRSWLTTPLPVNNSEDIAYLPTLGLRSDDAWCEPSPAPTVSHTGFTGTSFCTEPDGEWSLVLLTNRVHPTREQGVVPPMRKSIVAAVMAEADR